MTWLGIFITTTFLILLAEAFTGLA